MNFRLISLTAMSKNQCRARIETGGRAIEAIFTIDDRGPIVVASPEPYVFDQFEGSAEEQRSITNAVVAFCRASALGGFGP